MDAFTKKSCCSFGFCPNYLLLMDVCKCVSGRPLRPCRVQGNALYWNTSENLPPPIWYSCNWNEAEGSLLLDLVLKVIRPLDCLITRAFFKECLVLIFLNTIVEKTYPKAWNYYILYQFYAQKSCLKFPKYAT